MVDIPKGISKRGDKFRVSVMVKGKRKTATLKTLEEALAALQQMKIGLFDVTSGQYTNWNLKTAWEHYVDHRVAVSPHSTANHKKFAWYGKTILNHFGPLVDLDDINQKTIAEFFDELTINRNYSASVVNYMGTLLYQMQLHAFKRGRKRIQPERMQGMKLTKGRIRYVTDEEEIRMLDWYDHTARESFGDLVRFYLDTGLRKSEALRLKFRDVDMETGRISIWETKTNSPRHVKMTHRVRHILERLARGQNDQNARVFKHIAERKFYRVWIDMREAVGLGDDAQFVIHTLRHTCCTRLLGAGVDIRTVMQWMGHKSIEQTQRYAHFMPGKLDDAAAALDTLATVK